MNTQNSQGLEFTANGARTLFQCAINLRLTCPLPSLSHPTRRREALWRSRVGEGVRRTGEGDSTQLESNLESVRFTALTTEKVTECGTHRRAWKLKRAETHDQQLVDAPELALPVFGGSQRPVRLEGHLLKGQFSRTASASYSSSLQDSHRRGVLLGVAQADVDS